MDLLPSWITDLTTPIPDPLGLGQEAVDFIQSLLLEDGSPFVLHPVQERIVRKVFGDVGADGFRQIETLFLYVPSGQAKSTLAAAIALLLLSHPRFRIPKGQLVVAAATREQAKATCFGMVEGFIRRRFAAPEYEDEPDALASRFRIVSNAITQEITHLASGSTLKVLSRTPDSQEGLSVYLLVAEEVHAWNRPRIWPVLRKSQAKVTAAAPLTIVATTAGVGQGFGFDLYQQAKDIASGKIENPAWLPILYEAGPDEDWRDEAVWHRCNFALGTFKSLRTLRNLALDAATSLTARREFERYHLNRWHDGVADAWLDLEVYDRGADAFDLEDVRHLPCFVGVDAGQTSDLTAVVALFADADAGKLYVLPFFWCPAESIVRRSEEDGVPYAEWQQDGYLFGTEGASVDESAIEAKIRELAAEFDVQHVGFDPWQTRRMMSRLLEDGLPVVEIPQHYRTMSPAMKATERAILDGRLIHAGHPALRWCFANVPAPKPDPNGNIKPSKSQSRSLKIDGAVATMLAVFLAAVAEEDPPLTFESITGLSARAEMPHG